jgi:glycine cleavage system pyridoxal-binding protein P
MKVIEPGKVYEVTTAKGETNTLTFCHTKDGVFVDGITSEELLKVLINRHEGFMYKVETTENINVFTHLKQAFVWLGTRNINKLNRKKNKVR